MKFGLFVIIILLVVILINYRDAKEELKILTWAIDINNERLFDEIEKLKKEIKEIQYHL